MADFENGLPPNGTDISVCKVSNLSFVKKTASSSENKVIDAISLQLEDESIEELKLVDSINISKQNVAVNKKEITTITLSKVPSGINYGGFF